MVLSVNPDNGATNVRRDQSVSVTFNKAINPYTSSTTATTLCCLPARAYRFAAASLCPPTTNLTFSSGTLYGDATYTIDLPAGGISDPSATRWPLRYQHLQHRRRSRHGQWKRPEYEPWEQRNGIPTNQLLTLYMNRQVNPSTLSGNLVVTVNGAVYAGTVSATADNYEVQYTPTTRSPTAPPCNGSSPASMTCPAMSSTAPAATSTPPLLPPTLPLRSPHRCDQSVLLQLAARATNTEIDIQYSQPIDPTTVTTANFYQNGPAPAVPYTVALAPGTNNVVRISPPPAGWDPSYYYTGFCVNGNVKGTNG